MRLIRPLFVVSALTLSLTGCPRNELFRPAPQEAAVSCRSLGGGWRLDVLSCAGALVDLAAAGIVSVRAELTPSSGLTTARFTSSCELTLTSDLAYLADGMVESTPKTESCSGPCSGAECDGSVGTREKWTCVLSADGKTLTLQSARAGICRDQSAREVWRKE